MFINSPTILVSRIHYIFPFFNPAIMRFPVFVPSGGLLIGLPCTVRKEKNKEK